MSYSPVISYMMDRLSGFSTSSFRLQCLGSDSASANQIVRFELPTNALVDIRKFSFAVKLAVSGTGKVRLSEINNIIERVSVTVGGVELQSGFNSYNLLKHIKNVLMSESACAVSGHPEFVRATSYHTTPEIGKTQEERNAWLDENLQKYPNDPIIKELSQTDYEYADEKMIQYVLERQNYEQLQQTVQRQTTYKAEHVYDKIQEDPLVQSAMQSNDINEINHCR